MSNVDESTLAWAEANVPPDVSHDDWLDTVKRRVGHVTSEVARTLEAIENLKVNDFEAFGQRMCESHVSLRDDYEVSCQELDIAVDTAMANGALGARMTGGGLVAVLLHCLMCNLLSLLPHPLRKHLLMLVYVRLNFLWQCRLLVRESA